NKNVIKNIIIYNSLGQEIMSFKNIFSNDTQINIESSEAASLYFMKIIYENETNEVRKIKR
ncbi:MAG: T9SS type A sorting domain-containing protein, partial [Bacteroidia bacterium]|nr:T9SS type A sorting domain-containing protein [Bacteroidia bacterium]